MGNIKQKITLFFLTIQAYITRHKSRLLMSVSVLQSTEHRGSRVYIMQFGTVFMRLFVYEGQIHQDHAFIRPKPYLYFLYFLGFRETPFTVDELRGGQDTLLNSALDAIDKLHEQTTKRKK